MSLLKSKQFVLLIVSITLVVVIAWFFAFTSIRQSEALLKAKEWAFSSPEIAATTGTVSEINLGVSRFSVKYSDSSLYLLFPLKVKGQNKSEQFFVWMELRQNSWRVYSVQTGGFFGRMIYRAK
ncbi:MAG: hypothetical protein V4695_08505 [Pseudomonadota bacterium]